MVTSRPQPGLPDDLVMVRATPEFTELTVPPGLLKAHQVASGVWGNLVLVEGGLDFVFEDEADSRRSLVAPASQPIPPLRPHRVVLTGPARFFVEFHRNESPDSWVGVRQAGPSDRVDGLDKFVD